jgi:ABC-2 type transport system permease protein
MVTGLAAVTLAALLLARHRAGLEQVPASHLIAAVASTAALALAYAAVAFALGAAGAGQTVAIGAAGALAVLGFVLQGLGQAVTALRPLRDLMPWHWLLDADPLRTGVSWSSLAWPLALALALVATGTVLFIRRDLR